MHARRPIVLSLIAVIALAAWPSLRELATNLAVEADAPAAVAASDDTFAADTVATAVFAVG